MRFFGNSEDGRNKIKKSQKQKKKNSTTSLFFLVLPSLGIPTTSAFFTTTPTAASSDERQQVEVEAPLGRLALHKLPLDHPRGVFQQIFFRRCAVVDRGDLAPVELEELSPGLDEGDEVEVDGLVLARGAGVSLDGRCGERGGGGGFFLKRREK